MYSVIHHHPFPPGNEWKPLQKVVANALTSGWQRIERSVGFEPTTFPCLYDLRDALTN